MEVDLTLNSGKFVRGAEDAKKSAAELRNRLRDLAAVGASLAAVGIAAGKLAERGGEVINVQNAFLRSTGRQVDALEQLRQATHGLISDYNLMQQANSAFALGSVTTVDQFAQLAETAQILGRALGVDAAFALESLNIGIARQSRLILDNLGLIVSAERANQRYADSIGVAVSALTDAQRQEAFRIEALRQAETLTSRLGGVTLTAGDAFRQLIVELKNTTDWLSMNAAESSRLGILFDDLRALVILLRGDVQGAADVFRDWEAAAAASANALARTETRTGAFATSLETATDGMKQFLVQAAEFRASLQPVREFNAEMELLALRLEAIGTIAEPAIFSLTGGLSKLAPPTQLLAYELIPNLKEEIKATYLEFGALLTTLENTKLAMDEVNAAVEGFGKASRGLGILGGLGRFLGVSIPFLGNIGGLISAGSSFAGFFAEGGTIPAGQWGIAGEGGTTEMVSRPTAVSGPATVTPGGGMSLTVNMSGPANPIAAARDREWLRALAESASELKANGFRFA